MDISNNGQGEDVVKAMEDATKAKEEVVAAAVAGAYDDDEDDDSYGGMF